jgi:hypothetical protein
MKHDPHPSTQGHGDYERKDIGVSAVMYFLIGLAVALFVTYFVVEGVYWFLSRRFEAQQPTVSPLVANAPTDTRHLPAEYKTDSESADYEKYLQKNFPQPQLETNERTELNRVRLHEEETLATYDYIDQNAGTVHIPIDRAMDLLVQRGLPVRTQAGESAPQSQQTKEKK